MSSIALVLFIEYLGQVQNTVLSREWLRALCDLLADAGDERYHTVHAMLQEFFDRKKEDTARMGR